MADGFLGRWSQRKQAVRVGKMLEEPIAKPPVELPVKATSVSNVANPSTQAGTRVAEESAPTVQVVAPAPTLDDVNALNADSSFAPFVSRDVPPEVRNAAMKKLFTDPHYNVMDGLDIYIDDYSLPSPLSAATLRQMASAKFLNLFDEDPPAADTSADPSAILGEEAHTASAPTVASPATMYELPDTHFTVPSESPPTSSLALGNSIKDISNDHTDLRLQPDHAAGPPCLEREPERNPDTALQPVPSRSR